MKSVQISDEVHAQLNEYCKRTGRKVGASVDVAVKYWLAVQQATAQKGGSGSGQISK